MLRWALIFLIVALVAAVFGFGGIAADAAWIAKILFVVFLILFVVSLVMGRKGPGVAVASNSTHTLGCTVHPPLRHGPESDDPARDRDRPMHQRFQNSSMF